jgi:hypothetical protein
MAVSDLLSKPLNGILRLVVGQVSLMKHRDRHRSPSICSLVTA